jgi:hypothetical protein
VIGTRKNSAHDAPYRKTSGAKQNQNARERKKLPSNERRPANHFALIRSFLIDSDSAHALHEAFCANYFCTAFALHKIEIDAKYSALLREKFSDAVLAVIVRRCK